MIKGQRCLVSVDRHRLKSRALRLDSFDSVIPRESPANEAGRDVVFVLGVNIIGFPEINDDGFPGVGKGHRFCLRLAQLGPAAFDGLVGFGLEVCKLDPVKGEITLPPFGPPLFDHVGEQLRVFPGPTGIAFPLIPDHTFDSVSESRIDDSGENIAGPGVATEGAFRGGRSPGWSLTCGFRLLRFYLPGSESGFVLSLRLFGLQLLLPVDPGFHRGCKTRILFQGLTSHPGFGGGAAPGVVDQADRHIENFVKVAAEEKSDGTEPGNVGFVCRLPLALEVSLELLSSHSRNGDEPEVRMVGSECFHLVLPVARDRHSHVRLSRAHPDFSDQHILDDLFRSSCDGERAGFKAGVERVEFHGPFAVVTGRRLFRLVTQGDGHFSSRIVPSPDRVCLLLLEDHVVANDGGDLQLGKTGEGKTEEKERGEKFSQWYRNHRRECVCRSRMEKGENLPR